MNTLPLIMREDFKLAVNEFCSFLSTCNVVFDRNIITTTSTNDMVHLRFHKNEDVIKYVANALATKGMDFSYLETTGHTWIVTKKRWPIAYVVVNEAMDQITFSQALAA